MLRTYYIHTFIHIRIYIYIHSYMHTSIYIHIHPYIYIYIHTHIHTYLWMCILVPINPASAHLSDRGYRKWFVKLVWWYWSYVRRCVYTTNLWYDDTSLALWQPSHHHNNVCVCVCVRVPSPPFPHSLSVQCLFAFPWWWRYSNITWFQTSRSACGWRRAGPSAAWGTRRRLWRLSFGSILNSAVALDGAYAGWMWR